MKKNLRLLISYTVCFFIMMLGIFFIFDYYDKSFLYGYDGLGQHIITLKVFRELVLNFFKTGSINTYYFNIGLGIDFFANYAFYSFGDIFSYLSILVKESSLVMYYSITNVIRLYLVGLSFIIYARYKKINSSFPLLVGSLIYTFSMFNIAEFTLQPFFINAVILFPFLIMGIDKAILENKYKFLIFIEFILFVVHFYFAVLLTICGIVYVFILGISKYGKKSYIVISKTFLSMIGGILLSSFILMPTASLFLDSGRKLNEIIYSYSPIHYQNVLLSFITNASSNECYIASSLIGVLLFFLSLKEFKKYRENILFILIMFIPFLIPKIGSMFSLGSYPLLRFSFVVPFMIGYISSKMLEEDFNFKNIKYSIIPFISYFVVLFLVMFITKKMYTFSYFDMNILYTSIILMIFGIIILLLKDKLKFKHINLFHVLTILLIIINSYTYTFYKYSEKYANHISEFVSKEDYLKTNNNNQINFEEAINYLKENDKNFYRVSFDKGLNNIGFYYNFNTISTYYSILPSKLDSLTYDMDSFKYQTNHMDNLDNRAKLLSLLNVKYFISDKNDIPYGFKLFKEFDKTKIYINSNYLEYASIYYSYIYEKDFDNLNSIEKEESLLNHVSLNEKDVSDFVYYDNSLSNIEKVDYKIIDNKIYKENKFQVNSVDDILTINVNSEEVGEYYLLIKNLKFSKPSTFNEEGFRSLYKDYFTIETTYGENIVKKDYFSYKTMPYVTNTENYLLKLGSHEGYNSNITIKFDKLGIYTFDEIGIYVSKFDNIENQIEELSASNFNVDSVKSGTMNASVDALYNGVLVFTTTYSDNYIVYVDDKKVDTFTANKYFLGINIEKGKHSIKIVYKTPNVLKGFIVSIVTLVIIITIFRKRK